MSPEIQDKNQSNTGLQKLRAGATTAAVGAWSNVDYVLVMGAGEAMHAAGTPLSIATATAAGIATAETLATSYLASRGIGDFQFEAKTKIGKRLSSISPVVSIWRGAGSGVILDQVNGREVTFNRRLVHSVPYGVAVGAWVATAAPEFVGKVAVGAGDKAIDTVESHPTEAGGGIALLGALAVAVVARKFQQARIRRRRA
jgi:hypothetical protein